MVFPKKLHCNMIFLALSEKIIFIFLKNMNLFFRRKTKDKISQKITWKYNIFCISGRDDISFSHKYDIIILSKKDLHPKNTLKDGISSIVEKDNIHSRKNGIYTDRKIKDDKKFYSVKYA